MKPRKIEYNGEERIVLVGNATLKSPLPTSESSVRKYTNANDEEKRYKLAGITVDFGNGQTTDMLASVPEKIYENNTFEVGKEYLTTIEKVEDRDTPGKYILLARMSALQAIDINEEAIAFALDTLFVDEPVVKL